VERPREEVKDTFSVYLQGRSGMFHSFDSKNASMKRGGVNNATKQICSVYRCRDIFWGIKGFKLCEIKICEWFQFSRLGGNVLLEDFKLSVYERFLVKTWQCCISKKTSNWKRFLRIVAVAAGEASSWVN